MIVTGVRAYERRDDLRANNSRLLDYVFNGGTLIVQYNKFEFNDAQYGPYPAKVSANRVTDENAPVTVLAPDDPVLTLPNEINEATWQNWVQERGPVFPRREGLALSRPRCGSTTRSRTTRGRSPARWSRPTYGKGRWVYVGLGLWRQLPAGTDGAYQLLANLISLGKAGAVPTARCRRSPDAPS